MHDLHNFDFADSYIISVSLEQANVEIILRRWDDKKFRFLFKGSCYFLNSMGINKELHRVKVKPLEKGFSQALDVIHESYQGVSSPSLIQFFEAWEDECVIEIVANSVEILECLSHLNQGGAERCPIRIP